MKLKVAIPPLEVKFRAELVLEVTSVPTISRKQSWADLEGSVGDSNDSFCRKAQCRLNISVSRIQKFTLKLPCKHILWYWVLHTSHFTTYMLICKMISRNTTQCIVSTDYGNILCDLWSSHQENEDVSPVSPTSQVPTRPGTHITLQNYSERKLDHTWFFALGAHLALFIWTSVMPAL